jgi:hypothetical protein
MMGSLLDIMGMDLSDLGGRWKGTIVDSSNTRSLGTIGFRSGDMALSSSNCPKSEKCEYLLNHWSESYELGRRFEALENANRMAEESYECVGNWSRSKSIYKLGTWGGEGRVGLWCS